MTSRHFAFLIFLCFSFSVSAQDPSYFTIGEDEFANLDIYTLLYDDETDILYAGTDRGFYKYTQNKFRLLPKVNEQIGDSFFQLTKDKNGDIFCCNLNGQIFKLEGDKLSLYYQYPTKDITHNFLFFFDQENNIITCSSSFIHEIDSERKKTVLYSATKPNINNSISKSYIYGANQFDSGDIYFSLNDDYYCMIYSNGRLRIQKTPYQSKNKHLFSLGGIPYMKLDDVVYNLNNNLEVAQHLDWTTTTHQSFSSGNNLIQLNIGSGIRFLEYRNDSIHELKTCFNDRFISSITQNAQQTLFLGTFKEGIMVVQNWRDRKNISDFPYSGIVSSSNNEVYLSTRKGEIFKDNNGPQLFYKRKINIDELFFLEHNYLLEGVKLSNLLTEFPSIQLHFGSTKDLVEVDSSHVIWTNGNAVCLLFKDVNELILPESTYKELKNVYTHSTQTRCSSVHYIPKERNLYYTSNFGTYSKNWKTTDSKLLLFRGKSFLGNDLEVYKNELIVASEKDGLLFYTSGKFNKQLTRKDGLLSNTIIKLKLKANFLFVLGDNGLQLYDLELRKFKEIGANEGIMADRVINFSLSKDKIWLLDKEGYYSVDLSSLWTRSKVSIGEIYLDSMLINKNKISLNQFGIFSHDQNALEIFFDYRDIETKGETWIWYKLEGVSDDWKILETSVNSIEFPFLPPGDYSFSLKAKFRDQESKTTEYHFTIAQPFWLRWWFILLCFLFICFVISALFFIQMNRVKRARNRELQEQKLLTDVADSQLKAIRSQMNPHFIFNSLNSIQALVLRKDVEKSYDYIVMFSDLVRKTLHFSEQDFIPLKDEMAFLEIYLQLESLRMKEEFSYSLTSLGNDSIQIPSLLNQPFLENAIHHGLLHKAGKKQLDVIFNCSDGKATCTIIDNGIGRSEALKIKQRQQSAYKSFSLNATNHRLQLLSKQNNQVYVYNIEDLFDESGNPSGTKVIVNFPFRHDY